jgi:DNA-binding transcriptional MocR family regulator
MNTNWKPSFDVNDELLYLAIANAISDDIDQGTLSAGYKLPTQRDLADQLGVALGTVTRAYSEAERRGLIRGEGRRGTFVGSQPTSRALLTAMSGQAQSGIDLSKNHPAYGLDPELAPALRALARSSKTQELLQYAPAAGLMRHRELGAAWLRKLGAQASPESVFVTTGAQHALSVIFAAETRRGDVIAAERYTYPGVRALAEQLDLQVVAVPTDEQGILPDALDSICRQKAVRLLYCNPSLNNPTNVIYPMSRRKEIAAVAAEHDVMIIEDEIMRPLLDDHPGFIADVLPDQTHLVVSASKAVAAGLRIGFIQAPLKSHQRLIDSLNASCLGAPPFMAELFALWFEDGTMDRTIERRRRDSAARQKVAEEVLGGFRLHSHPCSYHVWLELPDEWSGLKLATEAQLRGIAVTPAEVFAVDRKSPLGAVRLSLVVPPTLDSLRTGLKTVADLLRGAVGHHMATV